MDSLIYTIRIKTCIIHAKCFVYNVILYHFCLPVGLSNWSLVFCVPAYFVSDFGCFADVADLSIFFLGCCCTKSPHQQILYTASQPNNTKIIKRTSERGSRDKQALHVDNKSSVLFGACMYVWLVFFLAWLQNVFVLSIDM